VATAGKPFTWSEYNHPFPNRYQVEAILFSAGYAAFNDVDALTFHNYYDYIKGNDYVNQGDFIPGYFSINRHSLLMALYPTVSWVFRNGLIKSSVNPIEVDYGSEYLYGFAKQDAINYGSPIYDWSYPGFDKKVTLNHAVKTRRYFSAATSNFNSLPTAGTSAYVTDTNELNWNTMDEHSPSVRKNSSAPADIYPL